MWFISFWTSQHGTYKFKGGTTN